MAAIRLLDQIHQRLAGGNNLDRLLRVSHN